jgi:hypothetical protein
MAESIPSTQDILALMLQRDRFSQWMGLEIDEYSIGYCK